MRRPANQGDRLGRDDVPGRAFGPWSLSARSTAQALSWLCLCALVASAIPAESQEHVLVVIVNKSRPETQISSLTLARMFRGEIKFWDNKDRIQPLLPPASSGEDARAWFLLSVVKLTPREFGRHWQERLFRGENSQAPVTLPDERSAAQAVFASARCIALLDPSQVSNLEKAVRVLAVDGKSPADQGYPLKW